MTGLPVGVEIFVATFGGVIVVLSFIIALIVVMVRTPRFFRRMRRRHGPLPMYAGCLTLTFGVSLYLAAQTTDGTMIAAISDRLVY